MDKQAIEKRLQRVIDRLTMGKLDLPGISAAFKMGPGQEPLCLVSGWSRRPTETQKGIPLTKDTVFEYCSITKTFTAALTLREELRQRIVLDQNIYKWMPLLTDCPRIDGYITVRQLLRMTSGLDDFDTGLSLGMKYSASDDLILDDPRELALKQMFAEVDMENFFYNEVMRGTNTDHGISFGINSPYKTWSPMGALSYLGRPLFPPDSDWRYTNVNYVILGLMIQNMNNTLDMSFPYRKIALENDMPSVRSGAEIDSEPRLAFIEASLTFIRRVDYDNFWLFQLIGGMISRLDEDNSPLVGFCVELGRLVGEGLMLVSPEMTSADVGSKKEEGFRFDLTALAMGENPDVENRASLDRRHYYEMYVAVLHTVLKADPSRFQEGIAELKGQLEGVAAWLNAMAYSLTVSAAGVDAGVEVDPNWSVEKTLTEALTAAGNNPDLIQFAGGKCDEESPAEVLGNVLGELGGLLDCMATLSKVCTDLKQSKRPKAIPHHRADGHEITQGRSAFMSCYSAAGFLGGNARDLSIWFYNLFSPKHRDPEMNAVGRTMRCTKERANGLPNLFSFNEAQAEVLAPGVVWTGYGLGVMEIEVTLEDGSKTKLYGHAGGSAGFSTMGLYWPDRDISFSYLINRRWNDYGLLTKGIVEAFTEAAAQGEL